MNAIEERSSDLRRRTSIESGGRCMRRPRVARVTRSLKSEVGGLESVRGQSPRRLFLTQSRRGAEDAEVCLKKRTGKVPAGLISIENVLSAPMPSPDGSPVPIPVGLHGSDFSFGFSTKYHDREVGLIAYQLRSYSPALGRWLNRDPIEEEGGVGLYGYLKNTPNCSTELLGLKPQTYIGNMAFASYAGLSLSFDFGYYFLLNLTSPGVSALLLSVGVDPIFDLDIKTPVQVKGTGKWHFMTMGVPSLLDSSKRDTLNTFVSYTMSANEKKCCDAITVFRYVIMKPKFNSVPILKFIPLLEGGLTGEYILDGTLDNYRATAMSPRAFAPNDTPEGRGIMGYRLPYEWDFYFEAKCMKGKHKGRVLSSCQKFYHADGHWPWDEEWGGFFLLRIRHCDACLGAHMGQVAVV